MIKQLKKISRYVLIITSLLLGSMLFFASTALADSNIFNGPQRYTTPTKSDNGLEHAVYISAGGDDSNFSGSTLGTIINNDYWPIRNNPYFYEHLYLKNSNQSGGADISIDQYLRFPKDLSNQTAPFAPVGDPTTTAKITGAISPDQFTIYRRWGMNNIDIVGDLKPQQSIDVSVPIQYVSPEKISFNYNYQVGENDANQNNGTRLNFQLGMPLNIKNYPDFMAGQYLVSYKDKDGYYRQATDVQSLMPQFNFDNDIETDNFGRGLGTTDGSTLFVDKVYRVIGDKMHANNGQKFWDMLQTRGYAPVWDGTKLLTYESFTASLMGGTVPGNPDYFKYLWDTLGHNGIGGINWQVVKVLDADNVTVARGTKWNPLDHVKLYDPTKQNYSDANEIPVTKDNVKVTSDNGHISADGTLDTSTPGTYNVTYTYEAVYSDSVKRTISKTIQVTIPGSNNGGGGSSSNTTPDNNSSNNNNGNNAWNPSTPNNPNGTGLPNYAAVKGTAVYATKRIYMYKNPTFRKSQRIATYPKTKRVNRPMFVVIGYDRSNGGALRYKVRDVNHGKKTAGKIGYITANRKYVVNVYYQSTKSNQTITIISKKGVHAYKNENLTGKTKTYKRGTHLKVKKIVRHNLTTRYQLKNGYYVTTNKKLVIQGKY
ncbi:DUF5776 domain-containing protein [Lentilactobacillus otakiensis]|uniref:DUF5776 domain-containing protein n=1 Tax=Lentilactobacillus otakiensis TaxID=481720 RepID=UPI003D163536